MTRDPFALAGRDPLIALWEQRNAIEARIGSLRDPDPRSLEAKIDRECDQLRVIEEQIAATVPVSLAGAIIIVEFLRDYAEWSEWEEFCYRMAGNLIAGLAQLEEAAAEAERDRAGALGAGAELAIP